MLTNLVGIICNTERLLINVTVIVGSKFKQAIATICAKSACEYVHVCVCVCVCVCVGVKDVCMASCKTSTSCGSEGTVATSPRSFTRIICTSI